MNDAIGFAEVAGAIVAAMGLSMLLEWVALRGVLRLMPPEKGGSASALDLEAPKTGSKKLPTVPGGRPVKSPAGLPILAQMGRPWPVTAPPSRLACTRGARIPGWSGTGSVIAPARTNPGSNAGKTLAGGFTQLCLWQRAEPPSRRSRPERVRVHVADISSLHARGFWGVL